MYSTTQEGFNLYKVELEAYLKKIVPYDGMFLGNSLEREFIKLSAQLDGMCKVLGITEEEHDENIKKMKEPIKLEFKKEREEYERVNAKQIRWAKKQLNIK